MRESFDDFLFAKGLFAGTGEQEHAPEALVALAKKFNIRIVSNPGWATIGMARIAARNLGVDVPTPFYEGFPDSVLFMPYEAQVFDRLLHYARTYGLGDFSRPGHSVFEDEVIRKCFDEDVEVREFSIISEKEAVALLTGTVDSLFASSRPLNDKQYGLVRAFVEEFGYKVAMCNCKDTIVRLLLDTRDVSLARLLKLSDVIRLVEWLQFLDYDSKDIKKLNLRNRDRKFLTAVINQRFEDGDVDVRTCLEKKKLWKGLLHHLHYKPVNDTAAQFLNDIRNNEARSVYSEFERLVNEGDARTGTRDAVDVLRAEKGTGAVLRHLDYLLSMSYPFGDIDYIIDQIVSDNKIMLIQLLYHYGNGVSRAPRTFKFQKLGMMRVHQESDGKTVKRHSFVNKDIAMRVSLRVLSELERACKGTLGKVYVDEGMKRIGLPLQEGTSMGGVGTLPRGSRLPIPDGKKIRAFTYWERVDDIDLSAFALGEDGQRIEFSWRTVLVGDEGTKGEPIVFSGDQTSGYNGGSEFFDVDLEMFKAWFPDKRYLVFCDNVYSGSPFTACMCKAGYMMRDIEDSGEVFEPATVKSSFAITCASTFAYLFAIDIETREIVWLNVARDSRQRVAGETLMGFLKDYLEATDIINLFDFARMLATEVVDNPAEADVVFSDKDESLREGAELIRSHDMERIIELLN
jgi:hypothetical protein